MAMPNVSTNQTLSTQPTVESLAHRYEELKRTYDALEQDWQTVRQELRRIHQEAVEQEHKQKLKKLIDILDKMPE